MGEMVKVKCEQCGTEYEVSKKCYSEFTTGYRRNENHKWLCKKCVFDKGRVARSLAQHNRWTKLSEEDKEKALAPLLKGKENYYSTMTDEKWKEFGKRVAEGQSKMTEEERKSMLLNRSKGLKNYWGELDEETKDKRMESIHKSSHEWWNSLSDEERQQRLDYVHDKNRKWWESMTSDELSSRIESLLKDQQSWRDNMSELDKKDLSDKIKEGFKNYWNSLSDKEKEYYLKFRSELALKNWNSMSKDDQRNKINLMVDGIHIWLENLSDEERKLISDRRSEDAKRYWKNLDPKIKKDRANHQREAVKSWWINLSDAEKRLIGIKRKQLWDNLSSDDKYRYTHKRLLASNGKNKLHQRFEEMFYSHTSELYLLSEYSSETNGTMHSWDYGVFDYSDKLVCLVDLDGEFFHADGKNEYDSVHSKYEYDIKRPESIPPNIKHCIIREKHFDEDFKWFINIIQMEYSEFVKEEVKYLCAMPFPYPSYSDIDLLFSWNKLIAMNLDNKYYLPSFQCHLGDHIVYHFYHSLYDERVWKPKWIEEAIRSHMIYHPHMNRNKLLMCVPHEPFTPPGQARILLKDHEGEYMDDKCDVGIMLGCIASGIPYRATCANMSRYNEIQRILEWMDKYKIKYNVKIEWRE